MLTLDKVYKASHVLKEVLAPTQCIKAKKINPDADVYLKTENLQVTGSFKVRGAYFKISHPGIAAGVKYGRIVSASEKRTCTSP